MQLEDLKLTLATSLSPEIINDKNYKLASILVVIYGKDPTVIMTKKPENMKFHAGKSPFLVASLIRLTLIYLKLHCVRLVRRLVW